MDVMAGTLAAILDHKGHPLVMVERTKCAAGPVSLISVLYFLLLDLFNVKEKYFCLVFESLLLWVFSHTWWNVILTDTPSKLDF